MKDASSAAARQANGHARQQGSERLELLALAYVVGDPQSELTRDMTTSMLTDDARRMVLSIAHAWSRESNEPIGPAVLESRLAERGLPAGDARWLAREIETASVGLIGQDPAQLMAELQRRADERHAQKLANDGAMAASRGDFTGAIVRLTEAAAASGGVTWPDPEPLPELPSAPAWNNQLLPEKLRSWVTDIAERTQCPVEYAAVGAMVTLGSVIGRGCAIRPKQYDDWTVVPNLWGVVVGPPSAMKSPALSEVKRPLDALAAEAANAFKNDSAKRITLEAKRDAAKKELQKAAGKGAETLALETVLQDCEDEYAKSAVVKRYIVNDSSIEKLGEILSVSPRGVLLFRDELSGWLTSLDKQGHENDRAFYLESWDGTRGYVYDRISRGTVYIEAACVSLLGGIQPGPLARYISAAISGGSGADGLMQRMQMMVFPEPKRDWKTVDRAPKVDARKAAAELYKRLSKLNEPKPAEGEPAQKPKPEGEPAEKPELPFLRFDQLAQQRFNEWYGDLMRRARSGDEHEALEGHLVKYASLMPSLALICALADAGDKTVESVGLPAAERAIEWCTFLEAHARRVYASADVDKHSAARALLKKIKAGKLESPFTAHSVYRPQWSGLKEPEVIAGALRTLVDHGYLRVEEVRTTGRGGRPTERYQVHPSLRGGTP